ncbi:hypothetical protein [Coleofasciculus sp. LEGE 07092]|uniref:hypothetical protein n=1 Tax=Coleofasciculus sp. LEGE 07092 TaxID=2777969 RepID=UPI0018816621|nr:hypothetical protein [Coleofasciculus sp. LEGE 07092]MBE9150535.1 hypothetical protein [Coleofasciculus sp. LEGE 07092]
MQQVRRISSHKNLWKSWDKFVESIPFNPLMGITLGSLVLNSIINSSISEVALLSVTGLVAGIPFVIQRKKKLGISVMGYLVATGVLFFDTLITPANAQFMNNAESWINSNFAEAATVTPLIFNILRFLFLVYIGIALVQIIQAARQDEDWKSMVKTPLIVIMAVTVADVMTGLIVGGGG